MRSHLGDVTASASRSNAPCMGPKEYQALIDANELKEEDKLPATVIKKWREQCDRTNFSGRITRGPRENEGLSTLSSTYSLVTQKAWHRAKSRDQSGESAIVVEETNVEEITVTIRELNLTALPKIIKNFQGTCGDEMDDGLHTFKY